jgi:hypothetical protein
MPAWTGSVACDVRVDLAHDALQERGVEGLRLPAPVALQGHVQPRVEYDADHPVAEAVLGQRRLDELRIDATLDGDHEACIGIQPGQGGRCADGQPELATGLIGPFQRAGEAAGDHLADAIDVDVVAEREAVEDRLRHCRLAGRQLPGDDEDRRFRLGQ